MPSNIVLILGKKKKCSTFINHLCYFCASFAEQREAGFGVVLSQGCAKQAETWDEDLTVLWAYPPLLLKLLMRVEAVPEHWWSFIHSCALHCSYKCVFETSSVGGFPNSLLNKMWNFRNKYQCTYGTRSFLLFLIVSFLLLQIWECCLLFYMLLCSTI